MFGFSLLKEAFIPEINTRARLFRHNKTGAELLSLENDDENKSFGITFRTPYAASTGIAHIMEHSVLCGSRKYPVKEPFIELVKGSLKTFLNAMTFADMTTYPVASTNLQDFYNLVDVYLDAVFHPLIPPHILDQEGWHFELETPESPLTLKGVVYNEMKGAYSSADAMMYKHASQSLFPDTVYAFDSGGDPRAIPDLTYADFKAFHTRHYHPANARVYFYGDDDPTERLKQAASYLDEFEPLEVDIQVPLQPRFDAPRRLQFGYDAGEGDTSKKSLVTLNWMLTENRDPALRLGLSILDYILTGTPASPLRKALLDSGLGEDLIGAGLMGYFRQQAYSVGLRGLAVENAPKVEELILSTLNSLAQEGFDPATIEAALNTVEFRLRENNTGSFPRGLSLMFRALSAWNYGADPIEPLYFEEMLTSIRAQAGEQYFENLIKTFFLENPHRAAVLLYPDAEAKKQIQDAEQARINQAAAGMTPEDFQAVHENTLALKKIQETPDTPEALATLPFLKLSDIEPLARSIPGDFDTLQGAPVFFHDLFTNGLVYLDLCFDLQALPQDLLPYLPLFSRALLEHGTEKQDFIRLTQQIGSKTGGIAPMIYNTPILDGQGSNAHLVVRAKSTLAQVPEMMALLQEILLTVRLDNSERFRQMVLKAKAGKEAGLVPSGNAVAAGRLKAHFHPVDWFSEEVGGVNSLFFTRGLVARVAENWAVVLEKLEHIRSILVNRAGLLVNLTVDAAGYTSLRPHLENFIAALPAQPLSHQTWLPASFPEHEGLTIPAQVNYVAKGLNLYDHGYTFHGSALVALRYLRTTWLWEQVRVKGGAYGGSVSFDRISGSLAFQSYRDPNLLGTLENYDASTGFLQNLSISAAEIERSIIGTISDLDAYMLPDAKGFTALTWHLSGITSENRQLVRDQVLSTGQANFRDFGDALDMVRSRGHVVVLGSADAITAANQARGGDWLQVTKVL